MLSFISARELKVYPAGSGKFDKVIVCAIRDWLEASNSHFLGTIVRIVMGETSSILPVLVFCFVLVFFVKE